MQTYGGQGIYAYPYPTSSTPSQTYPYPYPSSSYQYPGNTLYQGIPPPELPCQYGVQQAYQYQSYVPVGVEVCPEGNEPFKAISPNGVLGLPPFPPPEIEEYPELEDVSGRLSQRGPYPQITVCPECIENPGPGIC